MMSIFSLENKTVLITGASSGIGKAVAQQCAAAGANCILTARNEDRLSDTMDSLEGEHHQIIVADLSKINEIEDLVSHLPKIDGLVGCAGIADTNMLKFSDDEEMLRLFNTNAFSTIRLVREIIQKKKMQKGASIALVSSISGVRCGYLGGSYMEQQKGLWRDL